MFDANDFDETLPGPWEWDIKRLAASVVIAGQANGFSASKIRDVTMGPVASYRRWMARYASMRLIEVWYASITAADIRESAEQSGFLAGNSGASRRANLEAIFSEGPQARRDEGLRVADRGRQRPAGHPRGPTVPSPMSTSKGWPRTRNGLHGLPRDDA